VQPGCEHDTTPLRVHAEMRPPVAAWADTTRGLLADLGPWRDMAGMRATLGQGFPD
jgi:hypothetical protein